MKSNTTLTLALIAAMSTGYAGIAAAQANNQQSQASPAGPSDGKDATIQPRGSNATAPANTPKSDVGAGNVNPQMGTQSGASDMQNRTATGVRTIPPDSVIGWPVMNRAGDEIGTVDGIVRDRSNMENYAVVDVGEFLSVGDRQILVPLDSLRIGANNTILMSQGDTTADLKRANPWNHAAGDYDVRMGDATRPETELNYGAKPEVDSGAKPDHTDDGSAPGDTSTTQ